MTHEFDGKKCENASTHQKEWGTTLIAELNLQGTEHILDLGCGNGSLTVQIAERVPKGKVVGIDASRGVLDAPRRDLGGFNSLMNDSPSEVQSWQADN